MVQTVQNLNFLNFKSWCIPTFISPSNCFSNPDKSWTFIALPLMHPPPFWHLSAPTFERWFLLESSQNFAIHDVYLQNCVLDWYHQYHSYFAEFGHWWRFFAGTYSCLLVNIVIARELSFYILTIYIPCFMIVLVSSSLAGKSATGGVWEIVIRNESSFDTSPLISLLRIW